MKSDLKIYFFGSIWGENANREVFSGLITHLKTKGQVLSEHLFTHEYKTAEHSNTREIHDRDLNWVKESDVMIGDVTAPSLGVGYELREGILLAKPILCLYRPQAGKKLSAMIDGSPDLVVKRYRSLHEATRSVNSFLRNLK